MDTEIRGRAREPGVRVRGLPDVTNGVRAETASDDHDRAPYPAAALRAERAAAALAGLDGHPADLADLARETEATDGAFVGAVVTEIVSFRAALGAPLLGSSVAREPPRRPASRLGRGGRGRPRGLARADASWLPHRAERARGQHRSLVAIDVGTGRAVVGLSPHGRTIGEPGSGTTSLLAGLDARAEERGHLVLSRERLRARARPSVPRVRRDAGDD